MRISFKKKSTWILVITILIVMGLMPFAYAKLHLNYSVEDRQIASDLAALSGMSVDDVFEIKGVIKDWEPIKENIFVYQDILLRVGKNHAVKDEAIELIGQYPVGQLQTVYEYLDINGRNLEQARGLVKHAAREESMEAILSGDVDSELYENYQPADKEQIRQWLQEGYLPQDVLSADAISMAKDMKVSEVLALKNPVTSWEEIGKRLGYEFKSEPTSVSLKLPDDKEKGITASDYQCLIKEANARAEVKKAQTEAQISKELGLTDEKIKAYQLKGFSLRDLQNAKRLAKDSATPLDNILDEKAKGASWNEMLAKHLDQKMGEAE